MMRWLALAVLTFPLVASAQKTVSEAVPRLAASGSECSMPEAVAELDAAGVRARLYNNGPLFWRGGGALYEVPKGLGRNAMFVTSLMVGGLVEDELRFAGSTFSGWEFWPGPLDESGTTTPETCVAYDRIWVVTTEDLAAYEAGETPADDLAEWPVAIGAPFYVDADGDGVQGDTEPTVSLDLGDPGYGTRALNLAAGERPVIFGRQTAWWIMNDAGGTHGWSGASALGIEVRVTAWVHGDAREPDLYESTFYRYEIVNRSAETIRDLHAGFFVDADLGNFGDDRLGADSTRQMLLFYNGDDDDQGFGGYGAVPPALGIDILSGAHAAVPTYKNGVPGYDEPADAVEGYRMLRGLWQNGDPIRIGGLGIDSTGTVTRWGFPGDEVALEFWSQENIDGEGTALLRDDKKGGISALPTNLAPGERYAFDVAILFGQGPSRLGSITALRRVSDRAQTLYEAGELTRRIVDPAVPAPSSAPGLLLPDAGGTPSLDEIPFTWAPLADTWTYRLELLDAPDASTPLLGRFVSGTETTFDRLELPLNRRDPLYWRVRALRLGVLGAPSEARPLTVYTPAFERITVVANAAGPLDTLRTGATYTELREGTLDGQQQNGTAWLVTAEEADTYREFLDVVLEGDNATRAMPHDFEARFTGVSVAIRASNNAVTSIPFEIWDIGVGTPDDPDDDVRLIPILHDVNNNRDLVLYRDSLNRAVTSPVSWHRPRGGEPGEVGYRRWAASAEADPLGYGPAVLSRVAFQQSGGDRDITLPEPGTVFRIESSRQVAPFPASAPEAALELEVRPNPTTGAAAVGYRLGASGRVRLRVVDMLGREVAVLVDEAVEAGTHRAGLGAGLAPGTYVVVLDTEADRVSRLVTVVR
ncbi:MAG: hypothetical protein AAGJ11_07345 [Bacteroidota bacterium]